MLMSSSFEPLRLLLRDRASMTCLLLEGAPLRIVVSLKRFLDQLYAIHYFRVYGSRNVWERIEWRELFARFANPRFLMIVCVYDFDRGLYECSGEFVSIILNVTMIYLIFTTIGKQTISFWKGNNFFFFFLEYNQKYNSSPIIGQTSKLNGLRIKLSLV